MTQTAGMPAIGDMAPDFALTRSDSAAIAAAAEPDSTAVTAATGPGSAAIAASAGTEGVVAGTDGLTGQAPHRLSDLRGRQRIVLIFYPGDNTPVCTAQLCALRDHWEELQSAETAVFGINPAGTERHARFAERHRLPFPLIADIGGRIAAQYGCRALFGLIRRTVFIIDHSGRIAYAQRGNPSPAEILHALHDLKET